MTGCLQAAADRLRQFNVPASEIARLEQTGTVEHDITIESPASGYVTEFNALPNQYAQAEMKLYTIADLSSVWVYANVYQTDVGQLKPGTPATVTVDAYPGRNFRGRIDQILPQVDPATRTVRVRFVFDNPGLLLKPGMFVNVNIAVPLGRQLVIPAAGVLQTGTREIAFIDHGGGYLEPREIETGPRLDDHVIVFKGLQAGDRIVSSANFLVDSEAQLQAAIGSFAPPPPGAGAAAAMNAPRRAGCHRLQIRNLLTPRERKQHLRVKLTGADGKPVTRSAGDRDLLTCRRCRRWAWRLCKKSRLWPTKAMVYTKARWICPAGGTWQVNRHSSTRDGHTIATKQLSVSATGGM